MIYEIKRTDLKEISLDSKEWEKAHAGKIGHVEWQEFSYCPKTTVRVLYNKEGLFLKFDTDEEELIYDCKNLNEDVFKDSCVEFFFKPDPENNDNYFNFEINATGTPLIGFGTGRAPLRSRINDLDVSQFKIESVFNEKGFSVKYFIQFAFLLKYVDKIGDFFYGNFQKCKEKGSNPHFVSYYPIKTPKPDFHRPEFFDKIIIEK